MGNFDIKQIKNEIIAIDPKRWWGDDFDVRFFLISKINNIKNKKILDVGGGIGVILSKLDKTNSKTNLDLSFDDLVICQHKNDKKIQNVCGSMTHLPFKKEYFDCVIAANILEVAKNNDLKNNKNRNIFPSIENTINEIQRVTRNNGNVFLTTPNNKYYKSNKLTYNELRNSILPYFKDFNIFFYNTYPKLYKKYRKLNLANIIPKILSKIKKNETIIKELCKTKSQNNYSVSFFVEINKKIY
jgi:ubiquinone/menaquinone biosynthesis C-methylase UbiE